MFDFLNLKKSVGDFVAQVKKIRAEIASLQERRAAIEAAPCTREDLKVRFGQYLDEQAGRYRDALAKSLGFFRTHPRRLNDGEAISRMMSLFGVPTSSANVDNTRTFDGLLAALVPTMRGELNKQIDAMEWPDNAIPLEGRDKRLNDIDAKLESLMAQEAELVDAANAAGIRIE